MVLCVKVKPLPSLHSVMVSNYYGFVFIFLIFPTVGDNRYAFISVIVNSKHYDAFFILL